MRKQCGYEEFGILLLFHESRFLREADGCRFLLGPTRHRRDAKAVPRSASVERSLVRFSGRLPHCKSFCDCHCEGGERVGGDSFGR